jgi:YidC/Oxa1 family membrane protein insertase
MRHAKLFLWIKDLSAPDQCYISNLFGIIDWIPPDFLKIGVWPIIMGISMFVQQKLSSSKAQKASMTQEAKIQQNMLMLLPAVFTYVCSSFPVGVVVYWTINNIISSLQQYYVNSSIAKRLNSK